MTGITTTTDAINAAQTILEAVQNEVPVARMISEGDKQVIAR